MKFCGFRSARRLNEAVDGEFDRHRWAISRWSDAPETMLAPYRPLDGKVDVWSIGCIFAELHGRRPLFSGSNRDKQMELIVEVLGTPSVDDMKYIPNKGVVEYINSRPVCKRVPFARLYPNANPLALDLLERMLHFDPNQRISVEDALAHPYFAHLKELHDVPVATCPHPLNFKRGGMNKRSLQSCMWEEIVHVRPHLENRRHFARRAIHGATIDKDLSALRREINANPRDLNAKDSGDGGWTALHYCVRNGFAEGAVALLEAKAGVDTKTYFGETPLHIASGKGDVLMAQLLLDRGTGVDTKRKDGDTALDWARKQCKHEVVALLEVNLGSVCN